MSETGKSSRKAGGAAKYIECQNGWLHKTATGQYTKIKAEDMAGASVPCECEGCVTRAEFKSYSKPDFDRGSTRSGEKRGFWQAGEGHVLGGGSDDLDDEGSSDDEGKSGSRGKDKAKGY